MTVLQAIVLGAVQGATEFLPVSSDGHLAVTYGLFGSTPDLAFLVFLHVATLIALVIHFWRDVLGLALAFGPKGKGTDERRLAWLVVLATAISGVLALALKRLVIAANESLIAIGIGFLVTSTIMALGEYLSRRIESRDADDLGWGRTALIAVAQALAALPGISRSGSTIATGMLSGLSREKAARFSFIIGIPIIAAAALWEGKDVVSGAVTLPAALPSAAGFVTAGVVGYLAIKGLLAIVRSQPLYIFSVYTAVMGVAVIVWGVLT